MRSFLQNFLAAKPSPVGIDFGTDFLRLAQVRKESGQLRLLGSEQRDIAGELSKNWAARCEFFTAALREMFAGKKFAGRQVILGLPAVGTYFAHLRLPKMEEAALAQALPAEVRGKLPIEPEGAVIRHLVAGEVFVDQEPRDEIIVLATRRQIVQDLLAVAEKANLDVVGMNLEIGAIVECFSQIYRRKDDGNAINCFLDLGAASSRVVISTGKHILFVRSIPMGCHDLNTALEAELKLTDAEAARRQRRLAQRTVEESALVAADSAPVGGTLDDRRRDLREMEDADPAIEGFSVASSATVEKIVEELNLSRRYYDSAFPGKAITRLIFVGGGASDRRLCQEIARHIGLPAQVGDPLIRVEGREQIDEGVKRPQPAWATAMGLSLGGSA